MWIEKEGNKISFKSESSSTDFRPVYSYKFIRKTFLLTYIDLSHIIWTEISIIFKAHQGKLNVTQKSGYALKIKYVRVS